jgi:Asp-tRNA(Asn)/Glu-tRNA(Gln) amidotransferase A subunit family amidase
MIPLALGTQTGGSVIRPASFCGVAAIKPSYRLLPTVGVKCYSWTLDTVGLFAAGVDRRGARAFRDDRAVPSCCCHQAFRRPRIGVVTQDFADAPEAVGAEALRMRPRLRSGPELRCARWLCPKSLRGVARAIR